MIDFSSLTQRQREVCELLIQGLGDKQISKTPGLPPKAAAKFLGISASTVYKNIREGLYKPGRHYGLTNTVHSQIPRYIIYVEAVQQLQREFCKRAKADHK